MGLPIWREPDEDELVKAKVKCSSSVQPPSLDRVRSSRIQRRPSVHGLRGRAHPGQRARPPHAPRLERSRPLLDFPSHMPRSLRDGIPPISTLLETAGPVLTHSPRSTTLEEQQRRNQIITSPDGVRMEERQRLVANVECLLLDRRLAESARTPMSYEEFTNSDLWQSMRHSMPTYQRPRPRLTVADPSHPTSQHVLGRPPALMEPPTDIIARSNSIRSQPGPADEWELMRSTITPDATLPSAESSFASAAASQSFTRNTADAGTSTDNTTDSTTNSTQSTATGRLEQDNDADSVSSLSDEECLNDGTFLNRTESLAYDMYYKEMETPEGRIRIAEQETIREREGNRFAVNAETAAVDIGFRLIEAAVHRLDATQQASPPGSLHNQAMQDNGDFQRLAEISLRDRERQQRVEEQRTVEVPPRNAEESTDPPVPYPVVAPTQASTTRHSSDMADALLADLDSGEQNLTTMRRIVERLASRDDVPEEWWMSMGLNLSRTAPRRPTPAAVSRPRTGRIERSTTQHGPRRGRAT